MKKYKFELEPIQAPRMVLSDKWLVNKLDRGVALKPVEAQRAKFIKRYLSYKDNLKILALQQKFELPEANWHVIFYKPMPESWSKTKRKKHRFTPCQVRPDTDNYMKAFKDALAIEDSQIWDERASKLWGEEGFIEVIVDIPRITKILKYVKENFGSDELEKILKLQ